MGVKEILVVSFTSELAKDVNCSMSLFQERLLLFAQIFMVQLISKGRIYKLSKLITVFQNTHDIESMNQLRITIISNHIAQWGT